MTDQLKHAFDSIHADEQLKATTKDSVFRQMRRSQRPPVLFGRRTLQAVCVCMLLFIIGGVSVYFSPTTLVSIDINPSVELKINRFDTVIGIESFNSDGQALMQTVDVLYQPYSEAIDQIIASETVSTCLSENELLSIAVIKLDEQQGDSILQYITTATAQHKNAYCYALNKEQVSEAHTLGLSYGKYNAFLQLQQYDATITPEQVSQMTMREIRTLLFEFFDTESATQANRPHNGNGNRYGKGNN